MKRQIIGAITLILSMTLIDVNAYANGNINPLEYEACSNTPEKRAKIPAIKGKSYNKSRKQLVKSGWKPVTIKGDNNSNGAADIFLKKGYKEVEGCAPTGTAPCNFRFSDKYGNHLQINTKGEQTESSSAMVSGYRFMCP